MHSPRSLIAGLAVVAALALALPVYAAFTTADNGNNNPSLTLNKPAGLAEGHFMLAQVAFRGDSTLQVNAPAGWTLIAKQTNTDNATTGDRITQATYSKVATATDAGVGVTSYQWTFGPTGTTNTAALGGIVGYSDVDTTNPIIDDSDQNPVGAGAVAADTDLTAPAVDTTQPFSRVVAFYALEPATFTKPAGSTLVFEHARTGGSANTRSRIATTSVVQPVAGSSGPQTATADIDVRSVAQTITLRRKAVDLGFATPARSGTREDCLGPITVQSQGEGDPMNVTADTLVSLSTNGSGDFYADSNCATALTDDNRTIHAGTNTMADVYYDPITRGTGAHQITASATGLLNPGSQTQTINKLGQTITFAQPTTPRTYGDSFVVQPTASSGLTVSVGRTGPCSIAAGPGAGETTVTMTGGTGNCVLTASQAGDGEYNAALNEQRTVVAQKRNVTVTADPETKVYGQSDPALTYQLTAGTLVSGDDFSGSLTRDAGDTVAGSPYAITQGTLSLPTSDYNLTFVGANLTITPKGLTTSGLAATDKTYNGTNAATLNFTGASLNGVEGTDDVALDQDNYTATFNNKNVGDDKAVTVASLGLTGTTATNYTVTPPAGLTANVTVRDTTATFAVNNRVYNGTNAATTASRTVTAAVSSDDVDLGGAATFADKLVGNGKLVTIASPSLIGGDADNYNLTSVGTDTANISKRPVTGVFTAADKDFDGTTAAQITSRSLINKVTGDAVSLTGGTATFGNANPGNDKTVTGSGFSLSGSDAGNYNLASVNSTTADIQRRPAGNIPPPKDVTKDAEKALGGPVEELPFDLNGLGFAFAPADQTNTLKVGKKAIKLFAIGGCDAPCTVKAKKTLVLIGSADGASAAATKRKIKLKTQNLSLAAGEFGVIKLKKLTRKQRKAIRKAQKTKLVVKTTLTSGGETAVFKKKYRLKLKK